MTETGDSYLLEPTFDSLPQRARSRWSFTETSARSFTKAPRADLVEPEITAQYACEAMIEHTGNKDRGRNIIVPDSVRQWIKLYGTTKIGERLAIVPGQECIGAVVGVGDSPKEALEHLKENAEALDGQPITIHIPEIAGILEEIEAAQEQGIFFTNKPLPEPADVVS